MPLIPFPDVRAFLPTQDLSDDQLTVAMKLVAGWLRTASGRTGLPDPLPDEDPLYSPALELVIQTVTNPEFLASSGYGPSTRTYPRDRERSLILTRVRDEARNAAQSPSGSFPAPSVWPEADWCRRIV